MVLVWSLGCGTKQCRPRDGGVDIGLVARASSVGLQMLCLLWSLRACLQMLLSRQQLVMED